MTSHPLPYPAAAGDTCPSPAAPQPRPALPKERREAQALLAALRLRIARFDAQGQRLEERSDAAKGRDRSTVLRWTIGVDVVDRHLPDQGLARHALHDVAPHNVGDMAAAMGFALALAIRNQHTLHRKKPILWCRIATEEREEGRLYGHGLVALGLARQDFLTVTLKKPPALYWMLEESLKSGCFSNVLGDVSSDHMDLTTSRRLALAAQAGKSTGIIVFNRNYFNATASSSRWCIESIPSPLPQWNPKSPGDPAWAVTLSRIRGGRPGHWMLQWSPQHIATHNNLIENHAPHHFTLVPGFPGRALHPRPQESQETLPVSHPALRTG